MSEELILVIQEGTGIKEYCLNSYYDFMVRLPNHHSNVKFYGKGHNPEGDWGEHVITTYLPNKTIHDIIREDLNGVEPDVIFMYNPEIATSDFTSLKSKVYAVLTDVPTMNITLFNHILKHNVTYEALFYNFLFENETYQNWFDNGVSNCKEFIYWPAFTSHIYDMNIEKDIDFFLSGRVSPEYSHRKFYREVLKGSGLNYIDNLGGPTTTTNDTYRNTLARSKFILHDGRINNRMVGKYFEAPLCGGVLISPDMGEGFTSAGICGSRKHCNYR